MVTRRCRSRFQIWNLQALGIFRLHEILKLLGTSKLLGISKLRGFDSSDGRDRDVCLKPPIAKIEKSSRRRRSWTVQPGIVDRKRASMGNRRSTGRCMSFGCRCSTAVAAKKGTAPDDRGCDHRQCAAMGPYPYLHIAKKNSGASKTAYAYDEDRLIDACARGRRAL